ncbi:phosphatidate cytidylyltransferase [Microbacterium sp. SA39]|uniref:phosphatidate cytidylyltransferase n=1 Tax=Microbacterium sp. SA39 TaxID=1263625 RepID=UPI00061F53C6|nr:phosphatidate cytidylyltransferase [Microbacterium sp. SA39]KJQ52941.1 Phosphatidate cytidylyltransferase [Microbacterium sp. SA39]
MSDDTRDAQGERPPSRRDARDAVTSGDGIPLADAAFPSFDATSVPPRPPLPPTETAPAGAGPLDTADHNAIREQWRVRRDELNTHVSHARDQIDQANERIKERTGRDLILATVIGLAFGAALLGSLVFIKALFVPFALAAALLGVYELTRALRASGRRVDVIPQLIAATFLVLAAYFAEPWLCWVMLFVAVAFVIVWRLMGQMIERNGRTYGEVLADAVIGGFVQIYVPFLAGIAMILLVQEGGEWWVLSFIAIAVAADTGAYAAGLAFGRHPMAPKISPKKTWEGFGGAVLASLAAGVLLAMFLLELPWWAGLIIGASILLTATLGDLGESMLKRDLGIKDMSSWLPGHGGLLDRLDSILPSTIPALGLYFLFSPWVVL